MIKNVLILSDMFTLDPSQDGYMTRAVEMFPEQALVASFSSRQLANIRNESDTEAIHRAFVHSGIDTAAKKLASNKVSYEVAVGFSIGGTILWQAIEKYRLEVKHLICVSATRLRYQQKPLSNETVLIYGEKDKHAPDETQIKKLSTHSYIIPGVGHEFYQNERGYMEQVLK